MASQTLISPPPVAGASSHPLPALNFESQRRSRLSAAGHFFASYGWVLLIILAIAWYLRARNPNFSTAYMDESLYIVYGRMFLSHHFEVPLDHPLRWSWGWYLWPAMAASADRIGGLAGVRMLGAFLGTFTVLGVFGFARRIFSPATGLASAAVFALIAPAVFASRIATRDCASICFFALGLWLYSRAWQENSVRDWLFATMVFVAALLCKYVVAIYFPFLGLLALWKGRKPFFFFSALLTVACAAYAAIYANDLARILRYGHEYHQLEVHGSLVWDEYVKKRADLLIIGALALAAWPVVGKKNGRTAALLLSGAIIFFIFQWKTRADRDFWKHATYPLLFLTPLAMEGFLRFTRRIGNNFYLSVPGVILLAVSIGWAGNAWHMEEAIDWANRPLWPNAEPILAYFDGRLAPDNRVLVDDSAFRYYFEPPLNQGQITDPFFFQYRGITGSPAYLAAVRDGVFDYIVLDGGVGEEARTMAATIRPVLSSYTLRMSMPDPLLTGQKIEIYERQNPSPIAPSTGSPSVQITFPPSGTPVVAKEHTVKLEGVTRGTQQGWYVSLEVFTNRWYPQGGKIFPTGADGAFSGTIELGGQGTQQCHHLVRARLYDDFGKRQAVDLQYGIARANQDGSAPVCR
jgi:hypothetical protein